jgi:hypothetical protein
MTERLALPDWNTPPRTLADWVAGFASLGHAALVVRDEDGDTWIEVAPLRLRGLAEVEHEHVASLHFELTDPDPEVAVRIVVEVARGLGWEVYEDEDDVEDSSEF